MLESLLLVNFQAHRKIWVEFDPFVTCIIGESDAGKSAILRALRWVCQNQPRGDSFIHNGRGFAKAILTVDGRKVTRKTGSGNLYRLDGKSYAAFGSVVPRDIQGLLDVNCVNFQQQHDSPFWFSQTPGQVSRELNQIINLGVIDDSLEYAASQLRFARANTTLIEDRLAGAIERKKELDLVPLMHKELTVLETKNSEIETIRSQASGISVLVCKVSKVQRRRGRVLQAMTEGRDCASIGVAARETTNQVKSLSKLITNIQRQQRIVSQPVPDTGPLFELSHWAQDYQSKRQSLQKLLDEILGVEKELCDKQDLSLSVSNQLTTSLEKAGQCPLCGNATR